MAEIALHNLSKRYGHGGKSVLALRNVTLNVRDGELLAIVGPSGCGKTTLLRLIAGLDQPTSGSILFDGQNVRGVQPFERNVAMVFQDFSLYPHMTTRKNIVFALRQRKLARGEIDKRVHEVAAALDIQGLLDRYPRELSGGERQRVALARALAVRPAVLLLDEPLSNLDGPLRAALRREIKSLHQDNKLTIIHVTHDQEEAMMLGDRIAVMRAGAIEQVGTPMEIYRAPQNRFVAGFIGWGGSGGSGGVAR